MKLLITFLLFGLVASETYSQGDNGLMAMSQEKTVLTKPEGRVLPNMAFYPAKMADLIRRYVTENIEYPDELKELGLEGLVLLEIVVAKNGELESVRVLESFSPHFSELVLNQISNCDTLALFGENYQGRRSFVLPVSFSLR